VLYFARWKIYSILAVLVVGLVFVIPNFLSENGRAGLPTWMPHKQINLGLDLQGGSHLLLEVDVQAVIQERLEDLEGEIRTALRAEFVGYTGLSIVDDDAVTLRIRNLEELPRALELINALASVVRTSNFGVGIPDIEVDNTNDGDITVTLSEEAIQVRAAEAVKQSIEVVRRRIDETGTQEPSIQRQGEDRILVQLPGVDDPDRIKRLLGKTAKMTFQMVDQETSIIDALAGRLPPGSEIISHDSDVDANGDPVLYVVERRAIITGEMLTNSQVTTDQNGQFAVSLQFNPTGGRRFGDATSQNVGQLFAIILDDKIISAPRIQTAILGGTGQITGNFTAQSAGDLATLLRAGALPAPLVILEERSVGPGLGADSVAAGKTASALAFILVLIFMLAAYGTFGLAADLALLINMMLLAAGLSALQANLTLPGIAGIILTVGMAVDANVLIFERIREENALGKTLFASVDAGYKRAMTTIIDANVTTFIAAVILYVLGSGPVRGFAVTLAIGIVTSFFTAFTVTRLLVSVWLTRTRPKELPI
jgi:protein-export membrane protein SecD